MSAGRYALAFDKARALLAAQPNSADALALFGEAQYKQGDKRAASESLGRALAVDRRHARAHWVSGNLQQDDGQLDRAITSYRRALRADPHMAEAHNDLGTAYFAKGWLPEAEQCYRAALELQPENFAAAENLAAALRAQGKVREARDAFLRTLKLRIAKVLRGIFRRPSKRGASAAPAKEAGRALEQARELLVQGKAREAEAALRRLSAEAPADVAVLHQLGTALSAAGKPDEAVRVLQSALALRSSAVEVYVTLGNVQMEQRRFPEALEALRSALVLDPGNAAAMASVGRILHESGLYREAEELWRLSLQQEPEVSGLQSNLAATLIALGRFEEAEAAARKALAADSRSVHAVSMLAKALLEQGKVEEAKRRLEQARGLDAADPQIPRWTGILEMVFNADFARAESFLARAAALSPEDSAIHIDLSRCLLIQQRFEEGWKEYEWRKKDLARVHVYRKFPYPQWAGEALEGKSLVVNGEQGLGDEIMFASCLGEVARRAKSCTLLCHRRLEPLFRRSFPSVRVIGGSHLDADKDPFPLLEGIDFQVAAGSLPSRLRRSAADFPKHEGYLRADEARVSEWRKRLAADRGLKVGLSWKGGTPLSDATRRTLALDSLEPLLRLQGVSWVNLQYGNSQAEREAFAARTGIVLHHWQEALDDLDETAALMSALDLRISVCNTQVHLCGALGKEVWVLTPLSPDWRYGRSGEDMLWYPAARMFRQARGGDWAPVVRHVADALRERMLAAAKP